MLANHLQRCNYNTRGAYYIIWFLIICLTFWKDQYLPWLRNFTYNILRGKYDQSKDDSKLRKAIAADRAGRPHPFTDLLRTVTLLVPPPANLRKKLVEECPALAIDAYSGRYTAFRPEDLDEFENAAPATDFTCFLPAQIDRLTIHATESNFRSFKGVAPIFNPTHFHLKSLEILAMAWRVDYSVIQPSWLALEYLVMEDVLPLRPEQGDMTEGASTISKLLKQSLTELRMIRCCHTIPFLPASTRDGGPDSQV